MLLAAMALLPGIAVAQPSCDVPAGWRTPAVHRAAATPAMRFALKPGTSAALTLLPTARVKFAAPSKHKAKPGVRYAGLAAIDVSSTGMITVVLSDKAYVDLVRDGAIIASSAHADPACGGIAKTVSFPVTPGRYTLQFSDAPAARIKMSIVGG